ncbi:MAG: hypothetical protein N2578_09820, partial [Bdellovibrionaceae bacterium]|nr:hypothetical protein [Pseudobdellovibrionaceae bacterium]
MVRCAWMLVFPFLCLFSLPVAYAQDFPLRLEALSKTRDVKELVRLAEKLKEDRTNDKADLILFRIGYALHELSEFRKSLDVLSDYLARAGSLKDYAHYISALNFRALGNLE